MKKLLWVFCTLFTMSINAQQTSEQNPNSTKKLYADGSIVYGSNAVEQKPIIITKDYSKLFDFSDLEGYVEKDLYSYNFKIVIEQDGKASAIQAVGECEISYDIRYFIRKLTFEPATINQYIVRSIIFPEITVNLKNKTVLINY